MRNRPLWGLAIASLALWACDETEPCNLDQNGRCVSSARPGDNPNPGGDGGVPGAADSGVPAAGQLAGDVAISRVSIYQGVEIQMMRDGAPVDPRNAPVVAGRPALIRVYVEPMAGWQPREVNAKLVLTSAANPEPMVVKQRIDGPSDDTNPNSTLNFFLDGAQLTTDLMYQVRLEEVGTGGGGDSSRASYPVMGSSNLGVQDAGESLKVVLVPIHYTADGEDRLPDMSAEQIERYRLGMYKIFPTPRVEITVRAAMEWSSRVAARGQGWSQLLQGVLNLRRSDNVPTNVYYYGVVTPAESFRSFCGFGCVAGLSSLSENPSDDYVRGSIGLGYTGDDAVGTYIHEVGHAHGRGHAPCGIGPQPSDPDYPYPGAEIGVWGYDVVDRRLLSPTANKDLMGYCDPRWISDYQYDALFERVSFVNALASWVAPPQGQRRWRSIGVDMDGLGQWSEPIELVTPPGGERRKVPVLDESGHVVGTTDGYFYPYSHIEGGLWLVPEPSNPKHHAVVIENTRRAY